ncbi:hypothetical protein [Kineothrix sp. MB12-C1]|uniref:hypothetical protein n=1 Tax=Kineothrix sp. MB12-C1 TaxID=3070215 RepID=UPI0027D25E48|nr:hypothetical protein [Kineothrix sp. MB12-C1]WMC93721.1 hypothetical protein RBB56_05535 [Kineothrix sp. MB12-C1]
MKQFRTNMKIAAGAVFVLLLAGGCGAEEPFSVETIQRAEEEQVLEAYAPLVENEKKKKDYSEEKVDSKTNSWKEAVGGTQGNPAGETQTEADGKSDYAGVTDIKLTKVTYGENIKYVLGDSDYLISEPNRENGNSKNAVKQTAKKWNVLKAANPQIPIYTYFINRATDMDWYAQDKIKVFSYADYFEKQLGEDTEIRTGQFVIKDVKHYMETGYKTDFHVNNRGSYEVYTDIYQMLEADMELTPLFVPEAENDYDNLLFTRLKGGAILDFTEEQLDVFRTYQFDLGEYDSYVGGKKAKIGLEEEYANGKIVRDVDFDHQFSYYGGQAEVVEFDFYQPDKPNLLLISDSQGRPSRKLLASHFNRTVFLDDFQYRSMDIQQLIEEEQIGSIIFMGQESMFEWYGK